MSREAGFTLLEMMLVLVLMGIMALAAIATLPRASTRPQAEKLLIMVRHAAAQPLLDGGVMRLQISERQVRLARLAAGSTGPDTPFTGYHWQQLSNRLAQLDLPEGMQLSAWVRGRVQPLPAALLFVPEGSQPGFTLRVSGAGMTASEIVSRDGETLLMEAP